MKEDTIHNHSIDKDKTQDHQGQPRISDHPVYGKTSWRKDTSEHIEVCVKAVR